jgi:hypothetical protein
MHGFPSPETYKRRLERKPESLYFKIHEEMAF